MPTANPRFPAFYQTISTANPTLFAPWAGDVFRSTLPRWVSQPYRLTAVGSVLVGGRWNVQKLIPAIYCSTTAQTVAAEADAKANRYGWTAANMNPQTRIGLQFRLEAVLDVTSGACQNALCVQTADLVNCDWQSDQTNGLEALTQALARAAFECSAEGLLVPSARLAGGINLIYFPSNRRPSSTVTVIDEANIPFMHGI